MLMAVKDATQWYELLQHRNPPQRLRPRGPWDEGLSKRISAASFGAGMAADALKAALLLWNDDLYASHELVQDIPAATGSLLHGIMHRMEGDHPNAEYWFRRTGSHPCYKEIAAAAAEAGGGTGETAAAAAPYVRDGVWDPYGFNRAVQQTIRSGDNRAAAALELVQRMEMSVVVRYCLRECFGGQAVV